MFAILNKSERLITTHLGDQLPPGLAVAVTEDTMSHPSMQALATEGIIEVTEIQDPPPPETMSGGLSREGQDERRPDRVGGGQQEPPVQQRPAPNPPPQQPRPNPPPPPARGQ
jgi:hypothetical protein